ncbi:VOC family protein [Govanella unica]|uniref:VOC family protein n=1 Tax=Govanella unica TaxID=2975056 RepID=A0A9X3TYS7_9PROT|nr:VOC family protein [Govania unica]MDA5194215.1 VOC family protein [Govania unica]
MTADQKALRPSVGFGELIERVDHVSWTVADIDAVSSFYQQAFGARELYRLGPIDAKDLPPGPGGQDWMAEHVNVPGGCLTLAMLELAPNLNFELFQYHKPTDATRTPPRNSDVGGHHIALRVKDADAVAAHLESHGCKLMPGTIEMTEGPCAGVKNRYLCDPFGNQLELVEYLTGE